MDPLSITIFYSLGFSSYLSPLSMAWLLLEAILTVEVDLKDRLSTRYSFRSGDRALPFTPTLVANYPLALYVICSVTFG